MGFASGRSSVSLNDIMSRVTEADILSFYLNIREIPCVIHSPLRKDTRPSFGLYSNDGKRIFFKDLSNGDNGGIFDLLGKMWCTNYKETLEKVYNDIHLMHNSTKINIYNPQVNTMSNYHSNSDLQCRVREWRDYDIKYWESYGISLQWLKYAEVYPISHKIIIKGDKRFILGADKYAYAYVEHKEGKVTLKIYQPFNKNGYKWATNIDRSVWSLWTKIPQKGNNLFITSSLKDSLNLWSNLNIPALCLQGEGYIPKPKVMEELKERYKNIIVFYDNDFNNPNNPGRQDSTKLAEEYNLKRVEIPAKYESKDPSDLFKKYGKVKYLEIMREILSGIIISSRQTN